MGDGDNKVLVALGGDKSLCLEHVPILQGSSFDTSEFDRFEDLSDLKPDLIVVFAGDEKYLHDLSAHLGKSVQLVSVPVLLVGDGEALERHVDEFRGNADVASLPISREAFLRRVRLLVELRLKAQYVEDLSINLQEAQRAECIGSIAAGVVHEFNNLMFALLGYAEMAQADPDDKEILKECADVALQVGKRASSVAASLKAMSQKVRGSMAPQDINFAVKDALKLLKRYLEEHKVTLDADLRDLPVVEFSHGQMQQVFINLVVNAVQAMEGQKTSKLLKVRTKKDGKSRVAISFEDNGKGISEEALEKIFTPFFTTKDNEGREPDDGTGLGLSIVREVVKGHGGVVHVDSEEGKGARFTVYLKISEEGQSSDEDLFQGAHGTMEPRKVLVVDDEDSNLKMIVRILLKYGYEVYSSHSVHDAMPYFWSGDLDLILMDLIMPDVDGAQCVSVLREDGIETPILICTGVVDSPLIQKALDAGAQDVIMKPFSAQELLEAIYKCMRSSSDSE